MEPPSPTSTRYSGARVDDTQHSDIGMAPLLQQQLNVNGISVPVTIEADIKLRVGKSPSSQRSHAIGFAANDSALSADPEKKKLLSAATRTDFTGSIGTTLSGIQLSTLSEDQLSELALLVSERGVVFLHGQHFHPNEQVRAFKSLGKLRQDSSTSKDEPVPLNLSLEQQNQWHSDSSFEKNPPSYSLLNVEDAPEFGGEAVWVSQYGLYDELSSHMKGLLDGLHAVHSSTKRASSIAIHPAVRTHPVTGHKALNVTPGAVIGFEELKKKESDNLLRFLDDHINSETQHAVHWKWEPGCVVIWDNRCTAYRARPSSFASQRPSARISIAGEKPYLDPMSEGREERLHRIAQEEIDERDRLESIKRRYNNTPLRRILSQQVLGVSPEYQFNDHTTNGTGEKTAATPTADSEKKAPSRADSVLSAEQSEHESSEKRTALWTKETHIDIGTEKIASVPIRRSNTPMRRILERQVSSSAVRG